MKVSSHVGVITQLLVSMAPMAYGKPSWVDYLVHFPASGVGNFTRLWSGNHRFKGGSISGKFTVGNHSYYSCSLEARGDDCMEMIPGMLGAGMVGCFYGGNALTLEAPSSSHWQSTPTPSGIQVKTPVCGCYQLYGFEQPQSVSDANGIHDPYCFTAECMNAPDACQKWNSKAYFVVVTTSLESLMFFAMLGFEVYLILGLKAAGASLLTTTGTTLISATAGTFFGLMFCASYPIMYAAKSWWYLDNIGVPVGLTFMACFGCTAFLNVALMWLDVARSSKTLRKTGTNISRGPRRFVAAFVLVIFVFLVITMGILKDYFIGGAISIIFIIIIAVIYAVGARELEQAMSTSGQGRRKSSQLQKIISTSRRMQAIMYTFIVVDVVYALSSGYRDVRPIFALWVHMFGVVGILGSWVGQLATVIDYVRDATLITRGFSRNTSSTSSSIAPSSSRQTPGERSQLYTATATSATIGNVDNEVGNDQSQTPSKTSWSDETKSAGPKRRDSRRYSITYAAERELDPQATVNEIISKQLAPMVVVPLADFRAHGAIPRSNTTLDEDGASSSRVAMGSASSISQPREDGWTVVFVSHRWWGGNHPDDQKRHLKHGIICRGIDSLIHHDKLDANRVAVWIDCKFLLAPYGSSSAVLLPCSLCVCENSKPAVTRNSNL